LIVSGEVGNKRVEGGGRVGIVGRSGCAATDQEDGMLGNHSFFNFALEGDRCFVQVELDLVLKNPSDPISLSRDTFRTTCATS